MHQSDSTDDQRTRKHHTRSRVGCLTCRKRHVRCDGNQPTCTRCMIKDRECSWAAPDLPLRERRVAYLPGEHQPWPATQVQPVPLKVPSRSIKLDPFDTLPIEMPLKSMELLNYYHRINDLYDISSSARDKEVLRSIVRNGTSIRNTLLIAGVHYSLMTGDLKKYSSTILSHKIEAIRLLNKEIQFTQPSGYIKLVEKVASLCLTECGHGNHSSAETHVDALITILEKYFSVPSDDIELNFEEEMACRYFVLAYNYVHHIRSRIKESEDFHGLVKNARVPSLSEYYDVLRGLHEQDMGCMRLQLQAASMYPFFYPNLPSSTKFHITDVSTALNALRSLTKLAESSKWKSVIENPSWAWVEGSISQSHLAVMNAHVASIFSSSKRASIDPISGQRLTATWLNYSIAAGFYFHGILHVWNANQPMEQRLLRLIMKIDTRALRQGIHISNMHNSPDLWLWVNFVPAYYLATYQVDSHDSSLVEVEDHFDAAILRWSEAFDIKTWEQAHKRLMGIAWPANHPQDVPKMVGHER